MAIKYTKLTKAGVKTLAAGAKLSEHGLFAKKKANGDVTWGIETMVDGERIHRVVGTMSAGVTREQAERDMEALRTKAREGRLNLPVGRKSHRTFEDAAIAYIGRLEETGGRNMKAKRHHVYKLLIPWFGGQRIDRLTTDAIQRYVQERVAGGFKQATINRELATLSHLFRRLSSWGWMKQEWIPETIKGIEPRKHILVLSDHNVDRLMAAAIEDQDDRLWLFVAFGLNTGMRHSEILRVRYDQIDFHAKRIFIPSAKAGEREQPVTSALLAMLRDRKATEDEGAEWVFPNRNTRSKRPYRLSMAKPFLRAVIRAGLEPSKVTPHVMRHTAITRLVQAGVDLPTVQRISGHKTYSMVLRYVHVHGRHIDTAIAAIESAFSDVLTPKLHATAPPP